MSQMERAMETIVKTFHQHSGKKGDPDTLNWDEFKQLVNEDMSNILKKEIKDGKTMSHMMEDFDRNKDGYIEFDEYVALLSNILIKNHKEIYKNASLVTGHGNGT
ncbi:hypothetical protein U0070_011193 [Myodes glareolus]|uniref:EF-hand domain-containing protein n=1 Tax=Myodes glareolus TaxID=447135 RepID=A0AAW0HDX1_MYOGA